MIARNGSERIGLSPLQRLQPAITRLLLRAYQPIFERAGVTEEMLRDESPEADVALDNHIVGKIGRHLVTASIENDVEKFIPAPHIMEGFSICPSTIRTLWYEVPAAVQPKSWLARLQFPAIQLSLEAKAAWTRTFNCMRLIMTPDTPPTLYYDDDARHSSRTLHPEWWRDIDQARHRDYGDMNQVSDIAQVLGGEALMPLSDAGAEELIAILYDNRYDWQAGQLDI